MYQQEIGKNAVVAIRAVAAVWAIQRGRRTRGWYYLAMLGALAVPALGLGAEPRTNYAEVVSRTAGMVSDARAQDLARAHGLQVLPVTWEDSARYKNSSVGPNISDMTIQVQQRDARTGQYQLTCMPVIRFPNYDDRSADIATDKFFLLVGNEKGERTRAVSLREYLANIRKYLSKPGSWQGDETYMLANRDNHVLVSAQACFLPVPKEGIAEFNPALFNYQSRPGDPAVLTILATREGTSATIIDNQRDSFVAGGARGQRLFFNQKGERACLTGQRISDFQSTARPETTPSVQAAGQKGLNVALLIQVPLRRKAADRLAGPPGGMAEACYAPSAKMAADERQISNVEAAVIGHGKIEGPFTEFDNLSVERDPGFPVRVTVQYYKATSNGVVSAQDMAEIAGEINKIYAQGDYVGSLVVDGVAERPTEYDGSKVQPPEWWANFWSKQRARTGYDRAELVNHLRRTKGRDWHPMTEDDLARDAKSAGLPGRPLHVFGYAVTQLWSDSTPGGRLLYATLLLVVVLVIYDLGQRGLRRMAVVRD